MYSLHAGFPGAGHVLLEVIDEHRLAWLHPQRLQRRLEYFRLRFMIPTAYE